MNDNNFVLGTGALQSPKDDRDWTLASAGAPTTYPAQCFIEQAWMKPSMQGKIGCCVGCTFEEIVRSIVHIIAVANNMQDDELSWRFVYAVCKALDGYGGEGTYPSLAAKVVRTYGVPLAKYCPNDVTLDHETFVYKRNLANIPAQAFTDALKRRSGADFAVPVTEDGIKQAITYAKANNGGVAILRRIGDTYWKDKNGNTTWSASGLLPIRTTPNIVSGHEELLYGFDTEEVTGRVRIYWLNHWSKDWADNGRAWEYLDEWLPYITEIRVVVASVPVVDSFKYNFTRTLSYGMKGADVVALQHVLKLENVYPKDLAFTGYFGDKTKAGVKLLQEKYKADILTPVGLSQGTGNVGSSTLKWLQKNYQVVK